MTGLELDKTMEALAAHTDFARTLERSPRSTIEPEPRAVSDAPIAALAANAEPLALEHTLGEGGMGLVRLGTQTSLGRKVAVKTLRPDALSPAATAKLLREAWVTGALEHPNVVPVYDVALDASGAPLVVMKRIEGVQWGALMHAPDEIARRFGATDALEWNLRVLSQVCNAVHFAHSRGILHRDLKPENVMIGAFGEVYVLDWGLAVSVRPDPTGRLPLLEHAREVAGTPCYMAPEMLLADPGALSERTDVYLLGAIFYEIFAGRPPHDGSHLQAIIASIVLSEPVFGAGFPQEAAAMCRTALHREPDGRFESAERLRVAIEDYLQHRGSRKLAHEARQSLDKLLALLEIGSPSEERSLAAYNLLGECRFGYRAALAAWEGNDAARKGLDRALVAVATHELTEGSPASAAALLREVASVPESLNERVEAAVRARADEEARLRKLGEDWNPTIGTRTRTFLGSAFGLLWTASPLAAHAYLAHGGELTATMLVVPSLAFLALGVGVYVWARESLTRTQLNRRLTRTVGLHFAAQVVLALGALSLGVPPVRVPHLVVFSWGMTTMYLAVYIERWFALSALVDFGAFVVAAHAPSLLYPLMSFANLVLTVVLVGVWFPRQDLEAMRERRRALQSKTRRFVDSVLGADAGAGATGGED
jgi:serine/threonine-protein kinase